MAYTPKTITANGNAQIDTAQSKFGGASGLFDGTGDNLTVPDSTDWDFGTGDFTIDFWFRPNNVTGVQWLFNMQAGIDSGSGIGVGINYTSAERLSYINTNDNRSAETNPSAATWYHYAVVRSSGTVTHYQDGTSIFSYANSSNITGGTDVFTICQKTGGAENFNGWIDEFRVSNTARWTTNFTPSSSAYNTDANTLLLLHMDGTDGATTFVDGDVATTDTGYFYFM